MGHWPGALRFGPYREYRPGVAGVIACNLCGSRAALLYDDCRDFEYFMKGPGRLHRCERCGLVMMHPLPTREELPGLYPSNYHSFDDPSNGIDAFLLRRYQEHQAKLCRRHLPPGGSMLEIGCATGDVLAALRDEASVAAGIELSKEACDVAWERGLDVFHGTLDEYETGQRFDLVFMSQVIEHVLDPVETVTKIAGLLKPGGVLYVETPNIRAFDAKVWKQRWGLIHYPRHLFLFDKQTVRSLLARGGLEPGKVRSEPQSCGWALSVQSELRRRGIDKSREPRSKYYPALLVGFLPMNALDACLGGTAFMSAVGTKAA
jgi:2-polyprenyl-3-methyl-5-hydroxy-6-metoxy-1,4-benzoquinol methylase